MIFASDNWSGASPKIVAAVADAAKRGGPAYGNDPLTKAAERRFSEIFEREVAVFFVGTGTIANSLSLGHFARPGAMVLAHREAHILVDEPGSTELFGGGTRPVALDGAGGKLTAAAVVAGFERFPVGNTFHGNPVAVTVTQMSELGTVYHPEEVRAIADIAHARGAVLHMDGARFASAVASLGVAPADITWRAGVDVMSFGGTKNGCLAAEAVVFFDPAKAAGFGIARQRATWARRSPASSMPRRERGSRFVRRRTSSSPSSRPTRPSASAPGAPPSIRGTPPRCPKVWRRERARPSSASSPASRPRKTRSDASPSCSAPNRSV
jgi:threonine aldolase